MADRPESELIRARPWRKGRPPARVLAIRLQALGDTVITLPYLQALRREIPGAELDFLTRREVSDIPKSVELFDRVFEIGGGRDRRRQLLSALALVPRLRLRRYDVVLDLQRNRLSRIVRWLLSPTAWSEFDRFSPRLAGERTRSTIEAAGLGPLKVDQGVVPKRPEAGLEALRRAGWDGASRLVALNPAGAFPGRAWPLESYARFADLWLAGPWPDTQFLLLGLPALEPKARYLKDRLGDRLVELVGRTSADQAFAVVRRCALVVSEDSGLMHMAWVAGVPTLGLFGASRAAWSRPQGSRAATIDACERADRVCMDGRCRAEGPTCLERTTPEAVLERALELLNGTR